MPDLLETLMSEKRLLQASILLIRSLKVINKTDMREIGAISDLRSYLEAQETVNFPKFLFAGILMFPSGPKGHPY